MKTILSALISVSLLGCTTHQQVTSTTTSSTEGLNITTRSGKTYRACRIHDVTLGGLQIRQGKQVTTIDFRDLPANLQDYFQYDAKKGRRNPLLAAKEAYQAWQRRVAEYEATQARAKVAEQQSAARLAREQREAKLRADEQQRRELSNVSPTPSPEPPRPSVPAPVKRSLPTLD